MRKPETVTEEKTYCYVALCKELTSPCLRCVLVVSNSKTSFLYKKEPLSLTIKSTVSKISIE